MVRLLPGLARRWLLIVNLWWAVYAGLPWLAPVLMEVGARDAGRSIYTLYSTQCHQMAQRSYFLFGRQTSYELRELQEVWPQATEPLGLGRVIGSEDLGWKVAWSDRMVSMYGATLAFGLLYGLARSLSTQRLNPFPARLVLLLLLPMALDGGSHVVSDLWGIDKGFRAANGWLAALTRHQLPSSFYAGDALGSFNSIVRLLTGILFGAALVGFVYPLVDRAIMYRLGTEECVPRHND